ncbi:hypothetical protein VNI00_006895 [Paramarasmius palmivorus]|uniref:Uncharacterized protein n=1 Tax=Paramarasmius palmivorus TaxID=297713 RepID=A0AAW0D775_9AGAR
MAAENSQDLADSSDELDKQVSEAVKTRLRALVESAELLGIGDTSLSSAEETAHMPRFFNAIQGLSEKKLSLKQSLHRAAYAEQELRTHLTIVGHEQGLINKWKDHFATGSESLEESTSLLERRRVAILKKAKEYKKELDGIKLVDPPVTISELSVQQEKNREKEKEIEKKRAKLKAYQGLPPDLEMAQIELTGAREEHTKLINIREKLLSRMVQDVP